MKQQPRILIVFARRNSETSTRFGGFVKRIIKNGGFKYADVEYAALEDLVFYIIDEKNAAVYDPVTKVTLKDYDFVYFKSWYSLSALAKSAALYLEAMGIPYADPQVGHGHINKVSNQMARWLAGVSQPETIWGTNSVLRAYVQQSDVTYPLVIKAVNGQKGQDNYVAHSSEEATAILTDTDKDMMLQAFIPNDGDYRIGVYGHTARWAIYRKSGGTSHLNNTSAGGTALPIPIEEVDEEVKLLAESAALATDLAISGVDIVRHKDTGKLYVFEANQGSQIVTGAFSESNMTAFDEGIKDMVMRRHAHSTAEKKTVIGRRVMVRIDGIDADVSMVAKVDTGAYQSSVDAADITLATDETGREYLSYTLRSRQVDSTPQRMQTYDFGQTGVVSSFGETEMRYTVPMVMHILGQRYETRVTLANRSKQKCQVLLGRTFLAGKFVVNVEYSNEERDVK